MFVMMGGMLKLAMIVRMLMWLLKRVMTMMLKMIAIMGSGHYIDLVIEWNIVDDGRNVHYIKSF